MPEAPRFLTELDAQRHFKGVDTKKAVLVTVRGVMYKHEADGWYRLDSQPRANLKEFTDAA